MKKIVYIIAMISILLMLTACDGGNAAHVKVLDWEPSEIYTDSDIESAVQTVKDYFRKEFDGCTLTEIEYAGDSVSLSEAEYAKRYHADEVIVLYSSFDVDASGGDGSLNPNETYDGWLWILVREKGGTWKHVDHGY